MFEENEDQLDKPATLAEQDFSDEMQIKFAISDFYERANSINNTNSQEVIGTLKARRNVIVNMMQVYLSKFDNKIIMDDFATALKKAKKEAIKDGKLHKYPQVLNEIRAVGVFLGIRQNIADKLAEQLLTVMQQEEAERGE
jgi:hypothetical protein